MFWTADRIYSQGIEQAQQRIYEFFLETVRHKSPDAVLIDFKDLFINFNDQHNLEIAAAFDQILTAYNEKEFFYTLKRCCYILINNWTVSNHRSYVQSLIDLFDDDSIHKKPKSIKLKTLRIWLQIFIKSEDFKSLKLFAISVNPLSGVDQNWSNRFASYLLTDQYTNPHSSLEQRQAANILAQEMKEKFQFDLAMYTARLGHQLSTPNPHSNPTSLSDNVLNLVTLMLTKNSMLNCQAQAEKFLASIENSTYYEFKVKLLQYLDFAIADPEVSETLQTQISDGLFNLKSEHHDHLTNPYLILKTSKYLISQFTSSDHEHLTELFNILLHHTNPLNFVVLLLKLLLINGSVRSHLELKIALIIKYYSKYSEAKCKSVIAFIDMLNIALAIYAGETRYNLVCMYPYADSSSQDLDVRQDLQISQFDKKNYRIFSQLR
ncbi:hypothetical protein [Pseudanabaena sp. Chao 1811]|uniref:hypothetical protein n=1 Tax=Pseudanabaena sp. Chao 1811 TaxID=2963092 RepID=UPI0022F3A9D6|nr:hypothetical protein [Pseudanabaena sp. Chao 1811]